MITLKQAADGRRVDTGNKQNKKAMYFFIPFK